jgi:SAM-dependent methyltransferase
MRERLIGITRSISRRVTRLRTPVRSFAQLRTVKPISRQFGLDRGTPIDRHYIDSFLREHRADIAGSVLEVAPDAYTKRFGGAAVVRSDVIHPVAGHPHATIIGDFGTGAGLSPNTFDCVICTQTLQYIYDVRAAIATLHRILKPGGVLLLSVPTVSPISRHDMDRWGEYWRFTSMAVRRLLEEQFDPSVIEVTAHGNVLAAVAFLHGLSVEDLRTSELDVVDLDYELVICARAVREKE